MVSAEVSPSQREALTAAASRATAAGKSWCGVTHVGVSPARPETTRPGPRSPPTKVSVAGLGWAQPLAQPEMWMVTEPSRIGAAALATSAAMARAGIKPEAQAGAPAQATTARRGSSGRTMKPSPAARSRRRAAGSEADAEGEEGTALRRGEGGRAAVPRGIDQPGEGRGVRLAKGQANADGDCAVAEGVRANGFRPRSRRGSDVLWSGIDWATTADGSRSRPRADGPRSAIMRSKVIAASSARLAVTVPTGCAVAAVPPTAR